MIKKDLRTLGHFDMDKFSCCVMLTRTVDIFANDSQWHEQILLTI